MTTDGADALKAVEEAARAARGTAADLAAASQRTHTLARKSSPGGVDSSTIASAWSP